MRALVTGGAGLIGSHLVDALTDLLDTFTERAPALEEQSVGE
jgi:nucleoside-diphosphate-sugar epimerase